MQSRTADTKLPKHVRRAGVGAQQVVHMVTGYSKDTIAKVYKEWREHETVTTRPTKSVTCQPKVVVTGQMV